MLGFHHAVVAARQADGQPVAEAAGEEGTMSSLEIGLGEP